MHEQELISRLIFELKSAAADYRAEADGFVSADDKSLPELLARRCSRFEAAIREACNPPLRDASPVNGEPDAAENSKKTNGIDEKEQIFSRMEGRENRLERLYREVLRGDVLSPDVRRLLERQLRAVSRWHNFVITEEVNFIFGGELEIPSELNEI